MLVAAAAEDPGHFQLFAQPDRLLLQRFHCCSPTNTNMKKMQVWPNRRFIGDAAVGNTTMFRSVSVETSV